MRHLAFVFVFVIACGSTPPKPPPPPSGPAPACDSVSCVLDDHRGVCCYRLEHPDLAAFDDAMATIAPQANRCAVSPHYDGYFPVAVTFDPQGVVTAVGPPKALHSPLDPTILECIAKLVRGLHFARTATGDTLTYAFELHGWSANASRSSSSTNTPSGTRSTR